jgi:putative ABC transport system permease protein
MLCAYVIIYFLLPYFNEVANKNTGFGFFPGVQVDNRNDHCCACSPGYWPGIYPAFFLSAFNTIKVLKGSSSSGQGAQKKPLRSSLIVFQFFVSTTLIIATIIVYQQLHYMQNKKLGYDKDQVLFLPDARLLGSQSKCI